MTIQQHVKPLTLSAAFFAWTMSTPVSAVTDPQAQQAQFQQYSSCPATGQRSGACPGYRIGYKVALCAGGRDRWTNMVWLTEAAYRERQRRDAAACKWLREKAAPN